jgi:hypothetical protein
MNTGISGSVATMIAAEIQSLATIVAIYGDRHDHR